MSEMRFIGRRDDGDARIWVGSLSGRGRAGRPRLLALYLHYWNHSPGGFEWGYCGSGPAQTALAMLAHATRSKETACLLHQEFKFQVIAGIPREAAWEIAVEDVKEWVRQAQAGSDYRVPVALTVRMK